MTVFLITALIFKGQHFFKRRASLLTHPVNDPSVCAFKESLLTNIRCGAKLDFLFLKVPSGLWPKISLFCFSFGEQRIMFDNGSGA